MGFSILTKVLVDADLRAALFDAQTLSYCLLISKSYRNKNISIGEDPSILDIQNSYYAALRESYNAWDAEAVDEQMADDVILTLTVKSVVRTRGKKRCKRAKKQSARVLREAKKMWKAKHYGDDKDIISAINLIHLAFRESFLNVRIILTRDLYESIPENLTFKIGDETHLVRSLYSYNKEENRYILKRSIISSPHNMRDFQLAIAPYIFEKIYMHQHIRRK